jgi:hypothetical protein
MKTVNRIVLFFDFPAKFLCPRSYAAELSLAVFLPLLIERWAVDENEGEIA